MRSSIDRKINRATLARAFDLACKDAAGAFPYALAAYLGLNVILRSPWRLGELIYEPAVHGLMLVIVAMAFANWTGRSSHHWKYRMVAGTRNATIAVTQAVNREISRLKSVPAVTLGKFATSVAIAIYAASADATILEMCVLVSALFVIFSTRSCARIMMLAAIGTVIVMALQSLFGARSALQQTAILAFELLAVGVMRAVMDLKIEIEPGGDKT